MSAADEMTRLRHHCRNPHCRAKLKQPVENEHHAFCIRGCYNSFYLNRCRVCERDLRSRQGGRLYCRPPEKCRSEASKWPGKYQWRPQPTNPTSDPSCADSTGIKFGLSGHRPSAYSLRHWWWGDPVDGDLSLYDEEGLTIARLVLEGGSYRLRTPVNWPRLSWPDLEQARHGAESIALASLPLDAGTVARIRRENTDPQPYLTRSDAGERYARGKISTSRWRPPPHINPADVPEIPEFLLRARALRALQGG